MTHTDLQLEIVTQESKLLDEKIQQITITTESGEVTILPGHIGLFTRLKEGVMRYMQDGKQHVVAILGGFMDVSPSGTVTILADAADRAENLDIVAIEAAKAKAEKVLAEKADSPADYAMAETALRKMYLQLKAARIHRTGTERNV